MDEQNVIEALTTVSTEIEQLKKHVDASRIASIKDKVVANVETVAIQTTKLLALATSRKNHRSLQCEGTKDMLSFRMEGEACRLIASDCGTDVYRQEASSSTIVCGNFSEIKGLIRTIKLPLVEKIPPYRSWIFLDRNQRMAEDESVVGRRRIYYEQCGSEALICSDSEEETTELEEERHNFTESEDLILWKILHEHGQKQVVVDALKKYIKVTDSEIKSRYESLKERCSEQYIKNNDMDANRKVLLSTSLSAALDSFDNLFCRRCLVFDCRLHGCSQGLIIPSEKLHLSIELEEVGTPCGSQCYLLGKKDVQGKYVVEHDTSSRKENFANLRSTEDTSPSFETGGLKVVIPEQDQGDKKSEDKIRGTYVDLEKVTSDEKGDDHLEEAFTHASLPDIDVSKQPCNVDKKLFETKQCSYGWNLMERELYLKGVEIFGKNSCLIARNLLSGLKTCLEVSKYMFDEGSAEHLSSNMLKFSSLEEVEKVDIDYMETEPSRTRFWRRRGRSRKLKYTWKSTGHPVIRKRMADGKQQSCKQYSPCGCQPVCGKLCPCLHSGTCCEKYCGCPKSCKNRFRGCHCAKSHCRSRQCPCFAAGRECDPDVCRNCWISCGDGTLGSPPTRGDTYQCGNMNLLLKQQQRILLGKSDVAGWGAFLKNPVNKNDYLGEYTGELISHKEADKRGKIYDRANSSFLFDLNDQFVLDAYRKGDKLKFANHSSNPNCYAKVMMVADHRVGIFAKEHIDVGEELFYDYRYEPDRAPDWARKPEGSNSKKDDTVASHGRAKKVA